MKNWITLFLILLYSFGICNTENLDSVIQSYQHQIDTTTSPTLKGQLYKQLMITSHAAGHYKSAIRYAKESNQQYINANDSIHIGRSHFNLGNIYFAVDSIQSAKIEYQIATNIAAQNSDSTGLLIGYINMGAYYHMVDSFDLAILSLKNGIRLAQSLKDTNRFVRSLNNLAASYSVKTDFDSSLSIYSQIRLLAFNLKDPNLRLSTYLNTVEAYRHIGTVDSALHYSLLANALQDSLNNQQHFETIQEIESKYELELAQKQKKLYKSYVFSLFALLIVLLLIILFIYQLNKINSNKAKLNKRHAEELQEVYESVRREISFDLNKALDRLNAILLHSKSGSIDTSTLTQQIQLAMSELEYIQLNNKSQYNTSDWKASLQEICEHSSMKIQIDSYELPEQLKPSLKTGIYRIAEELVKAYNQVATQQLFLFFGSNEQSILIIARGNAIQSIELSENFNVYSRFYSFKTVTFKEGDFWKTIITLPYYENSHIR